MRLKSTFRFINMVKSIIHERRIFLAQFYRDVSLLIANALRKLQIYSSFFLSPCDWRLSRVKGTSDFLETLKIYRYVRVSS